MITIPKSTARIYLWTAIQFLTLKQNYEYLSNLGECFLILIQGLLIQKKLHDSDGNIPSHNHISEDEAEICSCEVVEQTIDDVLLSSSCSRIVEDVIRAHVAASEITLDPHLFGATGN